MNRIGYTMLMLLSSSAALKLSAKWKKAELVQLLVNPGQGSTALEMLLMSSKNVATLCKAGSWQCEPCDFGRGLPLCKGIDHDVNTLRIAANTWAEYWDLSRPLLMKKSLLPQNVVEQHQMYLQMVTEGLPLRMQDASIHGLRFSYIAMWQPLCLSPLNQGVKNLVRRLWDLSDLVEKLMQESGARVLVINYASFVWDSETTKTRVEEFLPEAGTLDTNFSPRRNIDIFEGNKWKPQQTISQYASAHYDDASSLGYNIEQQRCESHDLSRIFAATQLSKAEILTLQQKYQQAVARLEALSH
mmetsp:Transcript_160883/g.283470  ORF Transcript_160883/g.283470 Transcript_160883/m.283470 type:complete len:301 (+) Transcript_160883:69-971(+)